MVDVLLINSPIPSDGSKENDDYLPPLGLSYIATALEQNDVSVKIIDSIDEGLEPKEVIFEVDKYAPKLIGFNIFSVNHDIVQEIVESLNSDIRIVIGGNVTKFIYTDIIKWNIKNQCTIVIGDGEKIISDIYYDSVKEKPIESINNFKVYQVSKTSKYYVDDINSVRLNRKYIKNGFKNVNGILENAIVTSRGCPYNCAYCGSARSLNQDIDLRRMKKENIINEIKSIVENNGNIKSIRVLDDLFLMNRQSILDAIEIFNIFPQLTWRAMAHVKSFSFSTDLLSNLRDSGCSEFFIGVESGSTKIREFIHKLGSIDDIINVVEKILYNGINVKIYIIVGFPKETTDDLLDTVRLVSELLSKSKSTIGKLRVSLFKFRPYHGTELQKYITQDMGLNITKYSVDKQEGMKSKFNIYSDNYSEVSKAELDEFANIISNMK